MTKKLILGSLGYLVATFALAIVWHVLLFGDIYFTVGYIAKENPNFALGFTSIALQGIILTFGYQYIFKKRYSLKNAIRYATLVGIFFWTSHVLAFTAKQPITNIPLFMSMETVYLALQFGIFAILMKSIYGNTKRSGGNVGGINS